MNYIKFYLFFQKKKNFFKQDLIKECRLYLSFIKLFDSIANKYSNQLISTVINDMTYYESNPLNIIELLVGIKATIKHIKLAEPKNPINTFFLEK